MEIDWRGLLTEARIPWRDKGRNTSRGNVNICCPLCQGDEGFHMALAEDKAAFYCYRAPLVHRGVNLQRVLVRAGLSREEAIRLLNRHGKGVKLRVVEKALDKTDAINKRWSSFMLAHDHEGCRAYLEGRGFQNVEQLCRMHDIRAARHGQWAQRVLMPITGTTHLEAWTGRAIGRSDPKYLVSAESATGTRLLYVPAPDTAIASHVVIVEGPMDALKICAAAQHGIVAVALMGKELGASKLLHLTAILAKGARVSLCLDADSSFSDEIHVRKALREAQVFPDRLRLPPHTKDAGEMTYGDIRQWLETA